MLSNDVMVFPSGDGGGILLTDRKFLVRPLHQYVFSSLSHFPPPQSVDFEKKFFEFYRTVSFCIILRQSKQTKMKS